MKKRGMQWGMKYNIQVNTATAVPTKVWSGMQEMKYKQERGKSSTNRNVKNQVQTGMREIKYTPDRGICSRTSVAPWFENLQTPRLDPNNDTTCVTFLYYILHVIFCHIL